MSCFVLHHFYKSIQNCPNHHGRKYFCFKAGINKFSAVPAFGSWVGLGAHAYLSSQHIQS